MFAGYGKREEKGLVARGQTNLQRIGSNFLELSQIYSFDRRDKL